LTAVGKGDDEAIVRPKDIYGCPVDLPRLAPYMRENTEARKPACEETRDSVRDRDIELREPSLAKSHQEDACGKDGDCEDESGLHG
jgi:hypothetical protein